MDAEAPRSRLQVTSHCADLATELPFWNVTLGLQLLEIHPADAPSTAVLEGHGLRLRLRQGEGPTLPELELLSDDLRWDAWREAGPRSPGGTQVRVLPLRTPLELPQAVQATVLTRAGTQAHWQVGRAGMRYRDLLPQRHGGAFIASHIRIVDGGPVPDYVHHHAIRFQMIFCRRGWVRVVYEGQGEPFVMEAGDCVLQPPHIRHRVLESSAGAEVVEIAGPASHLTQTDAAMSLPSPHRLPPDHLFGGQRFVRHQAARAPWQPWRLPGFEAQDTGIADATAGLAGVRVLRPQASGSSSQRQAHDTELCLYYVLQGRLEARLDEETVSLGEDDSMVLASGQGYQFLQTSPDLRMLEVTLPASFDVRTGA